MTTFILPKLQNNTATEQCQDNSAPYCNLIWRRNQLLVKLPVQTKQPFMRSVNNFELLVKCLQNSTVNLVRIDPKLGEAKLRFWADACLMASKPIFLNIPSSNKQQSSKRWKQFLRIADWLAAIVFLAVLSPLMLGLVLLISFGDPGEPLFERSWHVGERGKLFQAIKFRTAREDKQISEDTTLNASTIKPIGRLIRKYGLDNLPQLVNVLRGEMSLVGCRCLTLEEALQLSREDQRQLNSLPGITSSWEIETETNSLHLDSQTL